MVFGTLVPILEFCGGIAILLGVFTRLLGLWVFIQFALIAAIIKPVLWSKGWGDVRIDITLAAMGLYFATHGPGPFNLASKILPGKGWAK